MSRRTSAIRTLSRPLRESLGAMAGGGKVDGAERAPLACTQGRSEPSKSGQTR